MKKLVVLFAVLAGLSLTAFSCSKTPAEIIGCAVQKTVSTSVTAVVAQELTCKNTAEIEKAINAELAKTKICKSDEAAPEVATAAVDAKSVVGDLVCTPVVDSIMTTVTAQIPTAWECDPSAKVDALKAKLIEKCKAAL